jgi:hypothetical protein
MTAKRLCLLLLLCWSAVVMAQQKTVRGTVKSSAGEPLSGASINVKGTPSGTTTTPPANFLFPYR